VGEKIFMYDNNNRWTGNFKHSKILSSKHLAEWCEESAVNEAIARLNIESLTDKDLTSAYAPKYASKRGLVVSWC
jgi:hypothetical protein